MGGRGDLVGAAKKAAAWWEVVSPHFGLLQALHALGAIHDQVDVAQQADRVPERDPAPPLLLQVPRLRAQPPPGVLQAHPQVAHLIHPRPLSTPPHCWM